MSIEIISGTVSHYEHSTETTGQVRTTGNQVSGSMQTSHVLTFRVDGRAVIFKSYGVANVADGDVVTVAGEKTDQGFVAYAFRNESTDTIQQAPVGIFKAVLGISVGSLLLICLILMSLNVIVGLVMLGAAGYFFIYKFLYVKTMALKVANRLLADTPKPAVSPSR